MLKFKVSPSVRAAAIPTGTGFGAFDGIQRHCADFKKTKGGVLRCASFKEGRGHPVCDSRLKGKIGRSPGLVRDGYCVNGKLVKSNPIKARKATRKAAPKKAARRAKKK